MHPRDALVGLSYIPRAAALLASMPDLRRFLVIPILASVIVPGEERGVSRAVSR